MGWSEEHLKASEGVRPTATELATAENPQAAAKVTTTYDALHEKTRQPEALQPPVAQSIGKHEKFSGPWPRARADAKTRSTETENALHDRLR